MCDVALSQLHERQAVSGWVGAGRALQDSPGAAPGALGCILDKHQYSQHSLWSQQKSLFALELDSLISLFC